MYLVGVSSSSYLVSLLLCSTRITDAFLPLSTRSTGLRRRIVDNTNANHNQGRFSLPVLSLFDNVFGGGGLKPISLKNEKDTSLIDNSLTKECMEQLQRRGFTKGLTETLVSTKDSFPMRVWIVDNSGSMASPDGNRIIQSADGSSSSSDITLASCTRWEEMQQTVDFHSQFAVAIQAPTTFRLLNNPGCAAGPQQFSVADRGMKHIEQDVAIATKTMKKSSPTGVTPLTGHVKEIRKDVKQLEPTLRRDGTKIVVVIATDGLPSDNMGFSSDDVQKEFSDALASLGSLPVWLLIRLCTDDEDVIDYYNKLDEDLELNMEVLDDFISEAKEVWKYNKWLNYGLPIHQLREMGYHDRVYDLLDERRLTRDEIQEFCVTLFGEDAMSTVVDPWSDWKGFVSGIEFLNKMEDKPWNPMTKKTASWINIKELSKIP